MPYSTPDLSALFNPRGIAVIGASPNGNRGTKVLENIARFEYAGLKYAVNPKYDRIGEVACVATLDDLPDGIDLVVAAVAADAAIDVVRDASNRGIKAAVVLSSGFGDGGVGLEKRDEMRRIIRDSGMILVGPNCYGIADFNSNAVPYSGSIVNPVETGGVALVMQSGALTHSVTDSAIGRGLGLAAIVTAGNELGLTVADYIDWYVDDPKVHTIGVFLEGLRDVQLFRSACLRAHAAGKAVVVLATGRSERSRNAALAHTGAVSGSGSAMRGLIRSVGAVQVGDLDEFRETLVLFQARRRPQRPNVAVTSVSGGGSGILADISETVGLGLADFNSDTRNALHQILPEFGVVANPLDATGAAADMSELLLQILRVIDSDTGVGTVCFGLNVGEAAEGQQGLYRAQSNVLAEFARGSSSPVVALSMTSGSVDPVVRATLTKAGIPLLSGSRPGLVALALWHQWHTGALYSSLTSSSIAETSRPRQKNSASLDDLSATGIRIPRAIVASDANEAVRASGEIGFPCVVKVESVDIAHKTEVGGVRIGLQVAQEVADATDDILHEAAMKCPEAHIEGVLVQEMIQEPNLEVLLGVVRDAQVGPVLSVAPGGTLVEIMGEAESFPLPVSESQAAWLIDNGPLKVLLDGYRGGAKLDRDALIRTVVAFSAFIYSCGDSVEAAEINPLIVLPEGAIAADFLMTTNTFA